MAINLNLTGEAFRDFYGRNVVQMPKLIADNRVPMNIAQLMQRRLELRNSNNLEVKSYWTHNYFDTGDSVIYHPDGRVKIDLDSQKLKDMTSESNRKDGALILTEDTYKVLEGVEFKKGKLGKVNESLTLADAKSHPIWKVLARNQVLLNDYADYIFTDGKQRFGYDIAMGIYLDSDLDSPNMMAWFVSGIGYKSNAFGGYNLDYVGRFVGIAPDLIN